MYVKAKFFITSIVRAKTFQQSGITISGTIITGILGMIFYIIMARHLGPASFGSFSVAIAAMTIIASMGDLGINTGLVKFVGKYISEDKIKANKFLKLGLEVKILVWVIILIIGLPLMPWIAESILGKPELIAPLRISLVGVGAALLYSYTTHAVQATQKFAIWSGISVSMNVLRLIFLAVLIYFGLLNLYSGLFLFFTFLFLGFLIGLIFLPRFFGVKNERKVFSEFVKFNKWVAVFTIISALTSKFDTMLTARMLSLTEVGVYSVAVSLSSAVPQIVYSLAIVAAPKLSSFNDPQSALKYLKKFQLFVIGLALLGLIFGIPLSRLIIPILYGKEYINSIAPFAILLLAQAVFLISVPAHTAVIYYFSYPKLFVWITFGQLIIVGIVGWNMIGIFGATGAALAVLASNLFSFSVPSIWVINKFRKL